MNVLPIIKRVFRPVRKLMLKLSEFFPLITWFEMLVNFNLILNKRLKNQLRFINQKSVHSINSSGPKIFVPLIETSHYQFYQILILAKALQLRGAEVKVLLCGSLLDGCELKNVRNAKRKDPCLNCRFGHKYVLPLFGLDVVQLSETISSAEVEQIRHIADTIASDYPVKYFYKGIDIIPITDNSVRRYYYGGIPTDIEALKKTRFQHLVTAMIGVDVAIRIADTWSPHYILNNMFGYSAWEPYYRYFGNDNKYKLFQIRLTQFNFHSIILNGMENYQSSERYRKYLRYRGNHKITEEERTELNKVIYARFSGSAKIFRQLNFFQDEDVLAKLPINKNKKNIFLFPNVYWEEGISALGLFSKNVISWVLETIEIVKDNPAIHLYIKPHPGEKYGTVPSGKYITDYIAEQFPQLSNNVSIIYPEWKISTYKLFPHIDLGIVFNGTIGLEMLLHNIPVVAAGFSPYGGIGLVYEPESLEEYKNILLGKVLPLKPSIDEVNLFAYFYFIKSLIPWTLTRQAYSDNFKGFTFDSLDDIMPGKDKYLDHICNCILDPENTIVEGWE